METETDNPATERLINYLIEQCDYGTPNLEELIEHLTSSGTSAYDTLAGLLGEEFFRVLRKRLGPLGQSQPENLAELILEYHIHTEVDNGCTGFLTTNYDSLLEDAYARCGYVADFGFASWVDPSSERILPLLKLHGSIDWLDAVPVARASPFRSEDVSWIGPRRTKQARDYPFNLIWGRARELLAPVDTIRVIGSSLRASDWHIIHLLFQWSVSDPESVRGKRIELINRPRDCKDLVDSYPELPLVPIYDLDAVTRFIGEEACAEADNDDDGSDTSDAMYRYIERHGNPVELWLQAKVDEDITIIRRSEKLDFFKNNEAMEGA